MTHKMNETKTKSQGKRLNSFKIFVVSKNIKKSSHSYILFRFTCMAHMNFDSTEMSVITTDNEITFKTNHICFYKP